MIIKYVILAKDDNPLYDGFWEINSEICVKILGITPVLFYISDEDSDFYRDKYGIVKKIKSVESIDTGFQSQIVRMYGCKYFPEDVCITSDLDMLMINRGYFIDQVKDFSQDSFVIYTSDAYRKTKPNRYPICYNAAKGKHYNYILNCDVEFEEYAHRLHNFLGNWHCDELYFTKQLDASNFPNIKKLKRGWNRRKNMANRRIDRKAWSWQENTPYIDCHCLRPYTKYKHQLDQLKKSILEGKLS